MPWESNEGALRSGATTTSQEGSPLLQEDKRVGHSFMTELPPRNWHALLDSGRREPSGPHNASKS